MSVNSNLQVPSRPKASRQMIADDYVDEEKLMAVLRKYYNADFDVKWSADRWILSAIPRHGNDILSREDIERGGTMAFGGLARKVILKEWQNETVGIKDRDDFVENGNSIQYTLSVPEAVGDSLYAVKSGAVARCRPLYHYNDNCKIWGKAENYQFAS